MNSQTVIPATSTPIAIAGELIYEYKAQITHVSDYGIALADVLSGAAAAPREGLRCDVGFEGPVTGPKLSGTVTGVDHGNLRADGRCELHIHAQITTGDGQHIALAADGIAGVKPGVPTIQLRESVTLTTSEPDYAWVNQLQIWATGTVDFTTGEIHVRAHIA